MTQVFLNILLWNFVIIKYETMLEKKNPLFIQKNNHPFKDNGKLTVTLQLYLTTLLQRENIQPAINQLHN